MRGKRLTTVLFAEVSGRDEFVRAAGPVMGWNGISDCVDRLQRTARSSGGRVVKVIGSELMMLFESPDAAADAASRMHAAVYELPPVSGTRLSVKVGYHAGPVIEGNDDLLGDTVKLVAALMRQARAGQTMTTPQTAQLLKNHRPDSYSGKVSAAPLATGGNREQPHGQKPSHFRPLFGSNSSQETTLEPVARRPGDLGSRPRTLRLSYGSESAKCGLGNEAVVVGRDAGCGLVTATAFASRRHCTILLGPDGFRIRDHSTYGTFLTNEGGEEIELRNGQEVPLAARGSVSLGCSRWFASRLLEFTGD
ncbi:MAG TPA: FHA domain-containing protein [Burkholderiales bacterium]|nr:FHA domain-containing protein [Burkholderiales bacterium]